MLPYFAILFTICIIALTHSRLGKDGKPILLFLWVLLVLFAGLRYQNPDWSNYVEMYREASHNSGGSDDIGFNSILKFLSWFSKDSVLMFLTVAGIAVALNFQSFIRFTPYVFLAVLLYFVHNYVLKEMIQIRVGLASSICLFAIYYLKEKNYKQTVLLWLIAISMHLTTVIYGLLIVMYWLRPSKKYFMSAIIISLVIGTFFPLGALLKNQLGIDDRLDPYIAYGDEGYASSLGIWNNMNTLKTLFFFLIFYLLYDKLTIKTKYFYILFLSYSIGLCWLICFNDFSIIGSRMSNILICVEPALLTHPLIVLKKSKYKFYFIFIIIYAIFIFCMNIAPQKITPYNFYLIK